MQNAGRKGNNINYKQKQEKKPPMQNAGEGGTWPQLSLSFVLFVVIIIVLGICLSAVIGILALLCTLIPISTL